MWRWSRMSPARKVVSSLGVLAFLGYLALVIAGHPVALLFIIGLALSGVSGFLWRRDEAYLAGLDADADADDETPG